MSEKNKARLEAIAGLLEAGELPIKAWKAYMGENSIIGPCTLCADYPGCEGCPIFSLQGGHCKSNNSLARKAKALVLAGDRLGLLSLLRKAIISLGKE